MNIQDKVIIVTGASMGIGEATAKALAAEGAQVVLAARSLDRINNLAKTLSNSIAIPTDMTKPDSIKNLIDKTIEKYGRIDVLINNAGQGMYGALETIDIDNYRTIFELNVVGPLIAMQLVTPIMKKQGGGAIINISSMVSKNYYPYLGAYASTKYALNALTLTARAELEKDKIVVSLVHPGLTATEFGKNSVRSPGTDNMVPRRREGMPEPDSAEHVAAKIIEDIKSGAAEQYMHQ